MKATSLRLGQVITVRVSDNSLKGVVGCIEGSHVFIFQNNSMWDGSSPRLGKNYDKFKASPFQYSYCISIDGYKIKKTRQSLASFLNESI